MKLKTRLLISFFVIMLMPCLLSAIGFIGMYKVTGQGVGSLNRGEHDVVQASQQLLTRYSEENGSDVKSWIDEYKDRDFSLRDVQKIDTELKDNYSYLVYRVNDEIVFNGCEKAKEDINEKFFPKYGSNSSDVNLAVLNKNGGAVTIKQLDFVSHSGLKSTFFVVTSADTLKLVVEKMFADFFISSFIILLLTVVVMVLWNYRKIVPRIELLVKATDEIRKGNLNDEIVPEGDDEIAKLYVAFEEMRKRLLANADEKMQNEEEQKQFISNIVHDLKTPITAIKGYAEGVLDGVASDPEKRDSYLRTIVHKSNDMNALINELSLYTKIDLNRIPYNFTMIPARQFFDDSADEIGMDLKNQKIMFEFESDLSDDVRIIADKQQLERVIHNIVSNSVKYMGPKTEADPGRIEMRVSDVGDSVQVELRDNGIGIAPNDLPHIFDRLFRADSSRNSTTGGSGIGLSIVKKIVDDHGGSIWATSTEGAGTTMYFLLRKKMEEKNVKNFDSRRRGSNRKPGERLSGIKRVRG